MEAKVRPDIALKKAELLAGGLVRIPEDFRLPFLPSRSTAGPGAGTVAVVFSFGNTRAKKEISRESGDFELVVTQGKKSLVRGGRLFLDNVELVPTLLHAPFQAFLNIDHACTYNCKFCSSPKLEGNITKNLTDEKIVDMVLHASRAEGFESVALTSAVAQSPAITIRRMAGLVKKIRELLPSVPIGVEPYATRPDEIDSLREAGADEIKLNIESFDRDIFEKICPERDYDLILHSINHASEVFGKNKVCSNIIFGLGESDDNVLEGVRVLANMGTVATLRALRKNEYNKEELEKALGPLVPVSAERMLGLARREKEILEEYSLTPLTFKTMCHTCLSCDIVPFWDV
ncbi:MAG TPA: radical SAM protein [Thermoplasmata archaeon]